MKQLARIITALLCTASATWALPVDMYGGAAGAQTIRHCSAMSFAAGDYMDSPASAQIVRHKLAQLGYQDHPGKGRKHKGAVSAVKQFQRSAGLAADGKVGPETAMMLAYMTAPDRRTANCLRLAMN